RPLVIGKLPAGDGVAGGLPPGDGGSAAVASSPDAWLVASETCALDLVGAEIVREVEPGELVVADENGLETIQVLDPRERRALCIWEYFYLARPDSELE